MATQATSVTAGAWTLLGTGLQAVAIQANGDILVFMGSSAPSANDAGFTIQSGFPVELPAVDALGGGVWVKAARETAGVIYASA